MSELYTVPDFVLENANTHDYYTQLSNYYQWKSTCDKPDTIRVFPVIFRAVGDESGRRVHHKPSFIATIYGTDSR